MRKSRFPVSPNAIQAYKNRGPDLHGIAALKAFLTRRKRRREVQWLGVQKKIGNYSRHC